MKVLTMPDLHGKDSWKTADIRSHDKVIFLGDYIDSKGAIPSIAEIENLQAITRHQKGLT